MAGVIAKTQGQIQGADQEPVQIRAAERPFLALEEAQVRANFDLAQNNGVLLDNGLAGKIETIAFQNYTTSGGPENWLAENQLANDRDAKIGKNVHVVIDGNLVDTGVRYVQN